MSDAKPAPKAYRLKQAAEILSLPYSTLYDLVRSVGSHDLGTADCRFSHELSPPSPRVSHEHSPLA